MSSELTESGVINPQTNGAAAADRRLLQGPQSRWSEFCRAIRIFSECIKGFRHLHFAGPCATANGDQASTPKPLTPASLAKSLLEISDITLSPRPVAAAMASRYSLHGHILGC